MLHKERRGQGRKRNTVSYPRCQPDGMWNHIKCSQRSLTKEGGLTLNVGSAIPQAGVSDWGQKREWVESQHSSLSAFCLRMQCDLCSSCHGCDMWTKTNAFSLLFLWPAIQSQRWEEELALATWHGLSQAVINDRREEWWFAAKAFCHLSP